MKMQYTHPSRIFIILMMQMNLLKKQNGMATLSLGIRWSGSDGTVGIQRQIHKQFLRKSCIRMKHTYTIAGCYKMYRVLGLQNVEGQAEG